MTLSYKLSIQTGKDDYYEEFEHDYKIGSETIAKDLLSIFETQGTPLDKVLHIIDQLDEEHLKGFQDALEAPYTPQSWAESIALEKPGLTAQDLLLEVLDDIEYFADQFEDEIKECHEDDAEQELKEILD